MNPITLRLDDDVVVELDARRTAAQPPCSRSAYLRWVLRGYFDLPRASDDDVVVELGRASRIRTRAVKTPAPDPPIVSVLSPPATPAPKKGPPVPVRSDYPIGANGDLKFNTAIRRYNAARSNW